MPAFFCPKCWKEVKENCKVCPHCGYKIGEFSLLSYEEKMILALNHRVDEFKINAIRVLKNIGSEKAVIALRELFNKEDSIPVLLEAVEALKNLAFRHEIALKCLKEIKNHRARVIRDAVNSSLIEVESRRSQQR